MQLTAKEFRAVVRGLPKLNPRVVSMARDILVHRKTSTAVGIQYGVSRQAAHRAAQKITVHYYNTINCPDGWEIIQIKLPPHLANKVKQLEQDELMRFYEAEANNNGSASAG